MPNNLQKIIKKYASERYPELIAIRRHLHSYPELSFEEKATQQFIQKTLKDWGITNFQRIGGTGTVVLLEGKNPKKKTLALRADIDALPIEEKNNIPYKSKNKGVMHACGHDVHTTCLLGALFILHQLRTEWEGTIKAIFQPGEEKNPGGASLLIKEGVLDNPKVDAILGLHVHTDLPVGMFSFRAGEVMASADEIRIAVKGGGGHAAAPHKAVDTILCSAEIIRALQNIISRNNDPFNPSVLSICAINGGHTTNVIPNEVQMLGTFRAMNEEWRFKAHELIRNIVTHTAKSREANVDITIDIGYPTVKNDPSLTEKVRTQAEIFIGKENCTTTELRMGAEDFGFYSQKIPGSFYRLGVKPPDIHTIPSVHTPHFNVDEQCLEYGAAMITWLAIHVTP